MRYETALLRRWSRRDRLAVLLIAITVAFLVGTTLVLVATGDATTSIATEFDAAGSVEAFDSPSAAREAAGDGDVVLPYATVEDGPVAVVAAVPQASDRPAWLGEVGLSTSPEEGIAVAEPAMDRATLRGTDGTITAAFGQRSGTVLPLTWGVTDRSTVDTLGPTGALVLSPPAGTDASAADDGTGDVVGQRIDEGPTTPLRAALEFFQRGSAQVLGAVAVVGAGVTLLVAVVVFGVVRVTARDRRRTVFVARATGATRRRLLAVFALRGGLLAAVGTALGYALGVVATNLAVNAAVVVGLPTSLAARVTPTAAVILGTGAVVTVALGALAAVLAARPVAAGLADAGGQRSTRAPGTVASDAATEPRFASLRRRLRPRLLSVRTLAPMVASLATFAAIVLLVVAGATAAAPLADDSATVVEPGAAHPIASTVPVAYADAFEEQGIPASPEILAFAVVEGEPVQVRGASFDRFATVSDARLASGERPAAPDEALVGTDLARTLDVDVGDTVTLGGSTTPAVAQVEVVGRYAAPGPYDDALLVRLDAARHLTDVQDDSVQFVRTDSQRVAGSTTDEPIVVDVSTPSPVARGEPTSVTATVANPGSGSVNHTVALTVDGTVVDRRSVALPGLATRSVRFEHHFGEDGERTVVVGERERVIEVVSPSTPRLADLPATVPLGSEPAVRVRTIVGDPVPNATVTVGERSFATDADGTVRLAFEKAGRQSVTVRAHGETLERSVVVASNATQSLAGSLAVEPEQPGLLTRPTARATVTNPWNATRTSRVVVRPDGAEHPLVNRSVTLAPGERTVFSGRLDRRGPGTYEVELRVDGEDVDSANVTVQRDDRLTSALASTDATVSGSGLGAGVATALGNLTILAGTLSALAGALAVGSVAFGLASAVDGRRHTLGIHRATGAGPGRVARLLVGDALRLALVATPLAIAVALGALLAIDALDLLVFFGVRLDPVPSMGTLLVLAVGAMAVVLVSALVVALGLVRSSPAALLSGEGSGAEIDRPGADDPAAAGGGDRA